MSEQAKPLQVESRWPAIIAIAFFLVLLAWLPGRVRVAPEWVPWAMLVAFIAPMAAAMVLRTPRSLAAERLTVLTLAAISGTLMLIGLCQLVLTVVHRPADITGLQLLASAIAIWTGNVLLFSLVYWLLDAGGPEARAGGAASEWLFPQDNLPGRFPGWHPAFLDYLYMGYETATAFSSTDTLPVTRRAKWLMMAQSGVSLVTIVIIAGRAINILR